MKVAIVDDNREDRDVLESFLRRYEQESSLKFEISLFDSAESFLSSNINIDIGFFDVEMPGMDGLLMAEKFREQNEEAVILFITNVAQYAIAGYKVNAFDYVIKPIVYPDFSLKMKKVMKRFSTDTNYYVSLTTKDGLIRSNIKELIYIEVSGHDIYYHFLDKEVKIIGSMNKEIEKLEKHNFVRVSKFFVINVEMVEAVKNNSVVLVNGTTVPVGRIYRKTLLDKLGDIL